MKISNPSELQKFLSEHDLHAKKSSSQNFLIDGNIVRKIVKEAAVTSDDVVIEIGPGPGALTEGLLETGCLLIAIEKDSTLAPLLNRLQTHPPRLEVYNDDILEFPLEEVLRTKLKKGKKAKVVANLPYHITTSLGHYCNGPERTGRKACGCKRNKKLQFVYDFFGILQPDSLCLYRRCKLFLSQTVCPVFYCPFEHN
jgi:hypothetical protein